MGVRVEHSGWYFRGPIWRLWIWRAREGQAYDFQVWGTGITHISRKRILELVEVLWENRDFQFSGSLGVGKNPSCEKGPLALGRKMEWELPEEGVQVPLRPSGLELRGLLLNGEVLVQPSRGERRGAVPRMGEDSRWDLQLGVGDKLLVPGSGLSSGGWGPKSELTGSGQGHRSVATFGGGLPFRLGPLDRFSPDLGFARVRPGVPLGAGRGVRWAGPVTW